MKAPLLISLILLLLIGCEQSDHDNHAAEGHNHTDGVEHDHSGDNAHVDRSQHLLHIADQNELFLQYETLVARRDSVFLAHITDLRDYTPVPGGFITITLSGGGLPDETFSGKRPVRAGIHIEVALPQYAGERQLSLSLTSPTITTTHKLGTVTVYPNEASARISSPPTLPDNTVYLEKEAQWQAGLTILPPETDAKLQLMLPTSAIQRNNDGEFIYVMHGAEFFERRQVVTEKTEQDKVIIVQGVNANERVIVDGGNILHDDNEKHSPHNH